MSYFCDKNLKRTIRENCPTKYSIKSNKLASTIGCLLLNRFLICIMVNNFATTKSFVQRLPLRFTRVNGINKAGKKITLMGQDGVNWMVLLTNENERGRMRLGRGWKGFCEAHGVKIGDSFVLELMREKDSSHVLKFCTK